MGTCVCGGGCISEFTSLVCGIPQVFVCCPVDFYGSKMEKLIFKLSGVFILLSRLNIYNNIFKKFYLTIWVII